MDITDLFPYDVLYLIYNQLDIKDLHELSLVNKELNKQINNEFVPDRLSTDDRISSSQAVWDALRKDILKKQEKNSASDPNVVLANIASDTIKNRAHLSGKIPKKKTKDNQERGLTDTIHEVSNSTQVTTEHGQTLNNLTILHNDKELIKLRPLAQVIYIQKARLEDQNYNIFWEALRAQITDLPDLKGSNNIRTWLKDPRNHAILGTITKLKITGPEFIFFPPEAKSGLTALRSLQFSRCYSLQAPDLQGLSALRSLNFFHCSSLQAPDLQGLSALQALTFSHCPLLQTPDLQGLSALQMLEFYECSSLQASLDLRCLSVLQQIECNGCNSLQSANLQGCQEVVYIYFKGCKLLQNVNLQNCPAVQGVEFSHCLSLQSIDFEGCQAIQKADFSFCTSLRSIKNLQGCQTLESITCRDCVALQSANLQGCRALRVADFFGCKSLKYLNVLGCLALESLKCRDCDSLQGVDFEVCGALRVNDFFR